MTTAAGVAAPSKALLRYLRTQNDGLCGPRRGAIITTQVTTRHQGQRHERQFAQRRDLHHSSQRCHNLPRSYIDDLFTRNREKCKALPAPSRPPTQSSRQDRYASSDSTPSRYDRPSLWQRLWNRNKKPRVARTTERQKPLPDYSGQAQGNYEETSAQLFNLTRALTRSPSGTELKLRCTEFDSNGSVTLVSGEFKKSELIAKYGLLPRDLRKIDSSVIPHILVRPTAILLNLLHLRVLIQSDRVLVFDAYGSTDSYQQSMFMYDLEGKLRQKPSKQDTSGAYLPYEFRALEAVLISVTSGLETEFALVRDPVTHILRALEEDIDREKLRHLLILSKKLGTFEQKARLVRDALDELLEADDDLAAMYLTETRLARERHEKESKNVAGTSTTVSSTPTTSPPSSTPINAVPPVPVPNTTTTYSATASSKSTSSGNHSEQSVLGRRETDHQEVEMLLESYHKICDEVVEISGNLISNIRNTEEVVKAILDANRNQLMLFEIKVSVATLGLAGGTLIAGLYGMNLENFIEETNWGFAAVTATTGVVSLWMMMIGLKKLRRVQKVRMWGELEHTIPTSDAGNSSSSSNRLRGWIARWRGRSQVSHGHGTPARDPAYLMWQDRERERRTKFARSTMSGNTGPMLWPGMDGLGLHKLDESASNSTTNNADFEPTNSDADDHVVRVRDDTKIGLEGLLDKRSNKGRR